MRPAGPAPTTTTSYRVSAGAEELVEAAAGVGVDVDVNLGERRGNGGAKDGRTRSSRDDDANSVKTGMVDDGI